MPYRHAVSRAPKTINAHLPLEQQISAYRRQRDAQARQERQEAIEAQSRHDMLESLALIGATIGVILVVVTFALAHA